MGVGDTRIHDPRRWGQASERRRAWMLRGFALWRLATRRSQKQARLLRAAGFGPGAMSEWWALWWSLLVHRALVDEPLLRRLTWSIVRGVRRLP